ncbi:MAG: FKBP-type peptidyl-prolyl cis-trans isomerase [Vicingus serpentipes]|nr:FKBP-type peptidyl-prolyl cis-trans isomerase [Vicingus serpentipes]
MKKIIFIASLLGLFFSCENPFPDFKRLGDGNYMKLLSFEEEVVQNAKNFASADIIVLNKDKVVYRNYKQNIIGKEDPFGNLLTYLNEGDSAVFMVTPTFFKSQFPGLSVLPVEGKYLRVFIKVHHFYDEMLTGIDEEMKEHIILEKYLKENKVTSKQKKGGIYVIPQQKGEGKPIVSGSETRIKYKATFTNYLQFDDLKQSFKLTYGTPDQVIKGLEIALKGMRKGEKAKIIIPSQLAFGEEGSSTGIVPPYTTVIYDLEIINVK